MSDGQNQWTGQLDLTVFNNGKKSVARDIFFEKALKVMRPVYLNNSDIPTFYIVNVGGGYLDGDRYKMDFNIEKNSDKEYVLGQVRQQGKILDLASEDFKKDKEVVLEAVKNDPEA
ncbi:MAG: DUF4116 domain-containing protein, partial [Staphylococcus xylosus]|nr:DUF4116 domain-containing protein [Staphylococcus xylosus]